MASRRKSVGNVPSFASGSNSSAAWASPELLSAVAVAPLLLLSLWARAQGLDGAIALVTGLAVTEAIILLAGEPAQVSLVAAASVAGLMITTEAMIAEEPKADAAMPGGMGGMGGMDGMM